MDFDLEADGTLKPEARREIFAGIDGEVREVLVDHNSLVEVGQPLLKMINPDIEVEIAELQGQIFTTQAEMNRVLGQMQKRNQLKPNDLRALEGEELELETKLEAQRSKLALKQKRASDLIVRSPIAGRVVWVTPKGAQGNRTAGIGVQFSELDKGQTKNTIENFLAAALKSERQTHTM